MKKDNTEEIGKMAATLSLVEIGLGSFLHAFKIPLSGHVLSINQTALLARSSFKLNQSKASLEISLAAALLKSLSPAGKKLTPMLAIATQGLLFYSGLSLFGLNYLGLFLGTTLSSSWAFLQPILFIYLLFGKNSLHVAEYFLHEVEKIIPHADQLLLWIILGLFIFKTLLAMAASLVAINLSEEKFESYQRKIEVRKKISSNTNQSHFLLALKDLGNPLFILTFLMTIIFFIFSNSSKVEMIWGIMRPLALGFILFYIMRVYPIERLSINLEKKGFIRLSRILNYALMRINKN